MKLVTGISTAPALFLSVNSTNEYLASATNDGNIAVRELPAPGETSRAIVNTVGIRSRSKITVLKYANLPSNSNLLAAVYKNGEVYICTNPQSGTRSNVHQIFKHGAFILDFVWSADDQLIAFTSVNNEVLIYDVVYGKLIANLHIHDDAAYKEHEWTPVKGISFDKAGTKLITLGDDKILNVIEYELVRDKVQGRIFKYQIKQKMDDLVASAKLNKFSIRKISWSIDDLVFCVPNTSKLKNCKFALVGGGAGSAGWHKVREFKADGFKIFMSNFSPCVYKGANGERVYVIACVSDTVLSIWKSDSENPVHILNDLNPVQDFCWSKDGKMLFLTSTTGIESVVIFDEGEFGEIIVSYSEATKLLDNTAKEKLPFEFEKMSIWKEWKEKHPGLQNDFTGLRESTPGEKSNGGGNQENESRSDSLTILADGGDSRGVTGTGTDTTTTAAAEGVRSELGVNLATGKDSTPDMDMPLEVGNNKTINKNSINQVNEGKASSSSSMNANRSLHGDTRKRPLQQQQQGDFEMPNNTIPKELNGVISNVKNSNTRKKRDIEISDFVGTIALDPQVAFSRVRIATPRVRVNYKYTSPDNENYTFEVKNGTGSESLPSKLVLKMKESEIFTDFVLQKVHIVTGSKEYYAVSTISGNIIVYTLTGQKHLPMLILGTPLSFLEMKGDYLLAVTCTGELYVWDLHLKRAKIKSANLYSLLQPLNGVSLMNKEINKKGEEEEEAQKSQTGNMLVNGELLCRSENLTMCSITNTGVPIVTLSNGNGYLYNELMESWTIISDSWWAMGSIYWDGLSTAATTGGFDGVNADASADLGASTSTLKGSGSGKDDLLSIMESHTNEALKRKNKMALFQRVSKNLLMKEGYENLSLCVSLNHLENKLLYYQFVQDKAAFERTMELYCVKLAEVGLKERLNEVLATLGKDLLRRVVVRCSRGKVGTLIVGWAEIAGVVSVEEDLL